MSITLNHQAFDRDYSVLAKCMHLTELIPEKLKYTCVALCMNYQFYLVD